MPLIRRIPKRGFNNARFAVRYFPVNLADLEESFTDGAEVNLCELKRKGIVGDRVESVKILASGEIRRRLLVTAAAFSVQAKAKIEAAGGQATVV